MAHRPFHNRDQDWRLKQRENGQRNAANSEIANHMAQLRLEYLSKRRDHFPGREEEKAAANHSDRDRVFQ